MSGYDQVRGFPEEPIKLTGKFNKAKQLQGRDVPIVDHSYVSRRVYVNINYTNPDGTAHTENRQDISVDIINSALATKINELAMTIPYTAPAYQGHAVSMIKEYSDAIEMLTRETIEPIFITFRYRDGARKTYEILGEKE